MTIDLSKLSFLAQPESVVQEMGERWEMKEVNKLKEKGVGPTRVEKRRWRIKNKVGLMTSWCDGWQKWCGGEIEEKKINK